MTRLTPVCLATLLAAISIAPAQGAKVTERTERASVATTGSATNGASTRPSISPGGRYVAFQSTSTTLAPDPNGATQDVFLRDRESKRTVLVSTGLQGAGGDGPSESAVVAGAGGLVAFASDATNLVEGDTNRAKDVFARAGGGPVVRVSVAQDGGQANGPSYEPDVSRDGRFVVFTSRADNLVPFDENGTEDVFVRDLRQNVTRRVSEIKGFSAPGRSRAPAISSDGGWVSFESTASSLVPDDSNSTADVFLAELATGRITRVSVSSTEEEQNRSVVAPFLQVSDVADGGRYVAFDSDATNLVRGDRNRDTDVFVRDVRRGRTERVSVSLLGKEGENDSYIPSITRDGRYVGFSSFAPNLWTFDRKGEDVFVHDRVANTTVLMSVTSHGRGRGPERATQLLRRPALADSARVVAFSTTAELAVGDKDGREDVVVRDTTPPAGRVVQGPSGSIRSRTPLLRLGADDPAARTFVCRVGGGRRFLCSRSGRLPRLRKGAHRLTIRAGGPGMIFDPTPSIRRFRVR